MPSNECLHRLRAEMNVSQFKTLRVNAQKMLNEGRNVARTLAQWREMQARHVQAVIQILAEPTAVHFILEVHIGGCDHPDVDIDWFTRADTHDLALLQYAQQLDLEHQWQVSNLVQQEGAPIRCLEPT